MCFEKYFLWVNLNIYFISPRLYIKSDWNKFDFFVVCASLLDFALEISGSSTISFLKVGP